MKLKNWFLYTIIVGLIPLIARGCIFLVLKEKNWDFLFDPLDFIILGLIVNINNINELERNKVLEKDWKTNRILISIILLIVFAIFFSICIFSNLNKDLFDISSILISSVVISISSIIFSFSIVDSVIKSEVIS
ncbi:hypothetical protein [Psychrilyobacter sp.]|uniref:hypothetical protein n=1 Tax=Psychrilyobacter sp. TaxID=2586924 RepID=UPI0030162340